jgi:hypothetical protein
LGSENNAGCGSIMTYLIFIRQVSEISHFLSVCFIMTKIQIGRIPADDHN